MNIDMIAALPKIDLKFTKPIQKLFSSCQDSTIFPSELKDCIKGELESPFVSYELLRKVHSAALEDTSQTPPRLWQLLISSEISLPHVEPPVRDPVLEQRIQNLKARFATEEYNRMTNNIASGMSTIGGQSRSLANNNSANLNWGAEIKQVNRYLLMFLNFVVVVGCSFFAGYKGVELIVPEGLNTFHIQLISGFSISFVVFFADLYFLLKNLSEAEES